METYTTLDNGGIPFKVFITPTEKKNETKPHKNFDDVKSIVGIHLRLSNFFHFFFI
jgi:hypothetical protein